MPRRDIGILEYQPVVFRLVEPNTDSIADNFTDEEVTLYDKILGKCRVFGSQWCQAANLNDPLNMQWKASEVGVNRKTNTPYVTSTVTSVAANKLIDTTQTFSGAGGAPPQQYLVLNTATGQSAWITARDSATQLSLNADIFTSPSEPYTIFNLRASTNGWSLLAPNVVSFAGGISGSTLQVFNNAPSVNTLFAANRWNRVTFRVTQYNYGAFTLIVNGPSGPLATYNVASAGEFEFYVWGETSSLLFNQFLTINVPTDFSGTIDFSQLEVYECNPSYTISALDLAGNFIAGQTITYGDSAADLAMLTGNIVYNGTWADFTNECGCVRLALTDNGNPPECEGELIPNPDFSDEGALWTAPENIFFPCEDEACNCGACFNVETTSPAALSIGLNCPLEEGREYCVSVEVCNIETALGWFAEIGVFIPELSGQTIGQIPGGTSSGVYNFTFTATGPATGFYIIFNDQNIYGCVTQVSLSVCEPSSPYYALSECFKLCAPACSTTISYRNPVNAYGLNYEHDANFRLFTRNQARIINQSIRDNALSVFKTGSGVGSNPYHDGLRVADFNQGPAPAYYHMVLATALAHSDCKVDGVLVQRISEYSPDFSDAFELSRATTEVQFKNQRNLRKTL